MSDPLSWRLLQERLPGDVTYLWRCIRPWAHLFSYFSCVKLIVSYQVLELFVMASYFREQDIDEYRECFYLYARSGQIRKIDELAQIMRSLGVNPTINELKKYFKDKNGTISFADFLDIMHKHTKVENIPQEIINAFKAYDPNGKGVITAKDLRHILSGWGEKLSPQETDRLFREAKIPASGNVRYEDFARFVCHPVPDYY